MKLIDLKSNAMIIGSKYHTSRLNFDMIGDVVIGDDILDFCKSIKNLGVIFDENHSFEELNRHTLEPHSTH